MAQQKIRLIGSAENKAYWLIRSSLNRKTLGENNAKLQDAVKETLPIGSIAFALPTGRIYNRDQSKRSARNKRMVRQEIKALRVKLSPPPRKHRKLSSVSINVIHCVETDPPSQEDKIEWFLLTSLPINETAAVIDIVRWYLCRWQIEIFFKILKSGCMVEKLQFESFKAISNCIALYMIVAGRILYLTTMGRTDPNMPCDCVFEVEEWQSVYVLVTQKPPPKEPPKLKDVILMIAQLGGFLGRKNDGNPGPQVMWLGLQTMRDITLAWETFEQIKGKTYV